MSNARTHFHARTDETLGRGALCGWWGGPSKRYTTDEALVTCKRCLAAIAEPTASQLYTTALESSVGRAVTGTGTRLAARLPIARSTDDAVRPWPTWRFALRSLVAAMDDGAPLKSTSAPSRFGQRLDGGNSGHAPEGDAGQRMAERLYAVHRALVSTFPAGFVAQTTPRLHVSPDVCRTILTLMVCGRPVHRELDFKRATSPGEKRRRGTIVKRLPIERRPVGEAANEHEGERDERSDVDDHVCEPASKSAGFAVTPGHVASIVRLGGLTIESQLERGGWVAQRDEGLQRTGAAAEGNEMADGRLRGWKSIAQHVELSETTARAARKWTPPIPVVELGNLVEADGAELTAWRKAGARAAKESA